jgi:hypothetical protein
MARYLLRGYRFTPEPVRLQPRRQLGISVDVKVNQPTRRFLMHAFDLAQGSDNSPVQ